MERNESAFKHTKTLKGLKTTNSVGDTRLQTMLSRNEEEQQQEDDEKRTKALKVFSDYLWIWYVQIRQAVSHESSEYFLDIQPDSPNIFYGETFNLNILL